MLEPIASLLIDLRSSARRLRAAAGFSSAVILTLALGITAVTVIFSLVNAVLLRPLPLPESNRLVALDTLENTVRDGHAKGIAIPSETSYPNFFDWRDQNHSFSSMAAYTTGGLILGAEQGGPARRITAVQVTSGFFTTLGVSPRIGRDFTRAEELPGAHPVVLSDTTWRNEFAADPRILGKTITLSDKLYTVVGIMPKGFSFPVANTDFGLWITMSGDAEGEEPSTKERGWNQLSVVGRLRPGVTLAQASGEMNSIQQGLAARYPDPDRNETAVSVVPQLDSLTSSVQSPLRILFAAVACLLLMVCANVAGLLLTRLSQRRGELAVRCALGATRAQLLRQLLSESLLLSFSAGLVGLAATGLLLRLLPSILPDSLPRLHSIALDAPVMAFALAVSLLTGLAFGVLPAWRASLQDPATALSENGRTATTGRRHYRLQSLLVIAQTAIGLVLLVGAGLLIASFTRTLKVDPGFQPDGVVTFQLSVPTSRYTEARRSQLYRELLPRFQAMHSVQSASAAYPMPLTQADMSISFSIAGRPNPPGSDASARASLIEPGFFQALRIPIHAGRDFLPTEHNQKATPVVIVNQAFERKFFPGQSAVGQHIRSGLGAGDPPPMREIVGVVGDVKRGNLTEVAAPEYYIPYEQAPVSAAAFALRTKPNGAGVFPDPEALAKQIRAEIAAVDPGLPVYRLQSYSQDLSRVTAQQRFQTVLLTAFAAIALVLAALGLYAVLSYMLSQRTQELGLRIALGAQRSNVLRLMLTRGLQLTIAGLAAGIVLAALLTRFLATLLYGVKPLDTATFALTALVLLAVSTLASLVPAWRAAMLNPVETLRRQ